MNGNVIQGEEVEIPQSRIDELSHNSHFNVSRVHSLALVINNGVDDVLKNSKFHVIDKGMTLTDISNDLLDGVFSGEEGKKLNVDEDLIELEEGRLAKIELKRLKETQREVIKNARLHSLMLPEEIGPDVEIDSNILHNFPDTRDIITNIISGMMSFNKNINYLKSDIFLPENEVLKSEAYIKNLYDAFIMGFGPMTLNSFSILCRQALRNLKNK